MIGQSCEHVGKPRLGINIIEFAGLNQGVGSSSAMPSGVRTCEGPVSPAHGNAADCPLRSIIAEADSAVVEEAREGVPT